MELSDYRQKIDEIDARLVKLFQERMDVSGEIAAVKEEKKLPVFDPAREREKLKQVGEMVPHALRGYTERLYTMLFELSRARQLAENPKESGLQQKIASAIMNTQPLFPPRAMVAVQGVEGANSQSAAEKLFATPDLLADHVASLWRGRAGDPKLVVCTGGEPLLQLDAPLIAALQARGFEIAIESNGTLAAPDGIDWICVSPKADAPVVQTRGQELKLVFPQDKAMPDRFEHLDFERFWLQPMDGPDQAANTAAAIEYCLTHPQWRLSVQTHKYIGVR